MRAIARDGQPLTIHDSGGTSPAILMLHGLAGHSGEWDELTRALSPSYRVVAVDQRGQTSGDMSRQAYVDDAVFLVEQLALAPVILCGQSLGGHTAMLVTAQRPDLVRSLIMIEAGPGGSEAELPLQIGRWIDSFPVPFNAPEDAIDFFGGGLAGKGWAAGLEKREDGWWPRFNREAMVASVSDLPPHWTEFEQIACPILVIRAEKGFMDEAEATRMAERVQLVTVPGSGHDVHLEKPAEVRAAIESFLAT